jgi:formylglycine-generating enzyme required for sulfatase activity
MPSQIEFDIKFIRSTGSIISLKAKGDENIKATLSAGFYTVQVDAYYQNAPYGKGTTSVEVIGGKQNTVRITMYPAKESIIEVVWIPAGTFTMGSPTTESTFNDERPQHSVTLTKGFWMGKYPVTQDQYSTVMGTNPSGFPSSPAPGEVQGRRPVENVTWFDAIEFCNKLSELEGLTPVYTITGGTTVTPNWNANGYRLPTEAQWEYACRAGTITAYNTGDTITENTGWYNINSGSMTHEVGKKSANAWGLYDMHGNVYEWCWDWYAVYADGAKTDPVGASSGASRVARGGRWSGTALSLRSAYRSYNEPFRRYNDLGFRVLRPE